IDLQMDRYGNIAQSKSDLTRVPEKSRELLNRISEQIQQSLDAVAVSLPAAEVKPGQTWRATRNLPVDTPDELITGALDMTYTYRGVRAYKHGQAAVVGLNGTVRAIKGRGANLKGQAKGSALIDLKTGRVMDARAEVDVSLDLKFEDETASSAGNLVV